MPKRAARFASDLVVIILAAIPIATTAHSETVTAEDCLSAPTGETPAGSHWRYRTDHINNRKCWYLRGEDGGAMSQALPQNNTPVPAQPAKPAIAEARAELRSKPGSGDGAVVNAPANPAASEAASANASVWNATAAVATRWPDLTTTGSTANAGTAPAGPASNATPSSAEQPQAAASTAPFANLSMPVKPETIPILIAAIVGALACAGTAALISRWRGKRRVRRRKARHTRGPIWGTTDDDRIVLSEHLPTANRIYRPRFARSVEGGTGSVNRAPEFARRRSRIPS